jgi:hypothetical protein
LQLRQLLSPNPATGRAASPELQQMLFGMAICLVQTVAIPAVLRVAFAGCGRWRRVAPAVASVQQGRRLGQVCENEHGLALRKLPPVVHA